MTSGDGNVKTPSRARSHRVGHVSCVVWSHAKPKADPLDTPKP